MQVEPIDNPKVTNVTLKQLDPHSRYRFQVRGRTSAGEGKPATREGATTLDGGMGTDLNPSPGGETHTHLLYCLNVHVSIFHIHRIWSDQGTLLFNKKL